MPRLSMWTHRKTADYSFIDNLVLQQFSVGGVAVYVHKYLGHYDQGESNDTTLPNYPGTGRDLNEASIQDLLFLENRDRRYDPDVYELRGHYQVQDNDFDLTQFGLMLSGDTIFITVHLNDMIDRLGRKIISGDVIELPNMRDDALIQRMGIEDYPDAINRFYEVIDAQWGAEGYSPTWRPHIWRLKCNPIKDSPEFRDIFGSGDDADENPIFGLGEGLLGEDGGPTGGGGLFGDEEGRPNLQSLMSTRPNEMAISDAISGQAEEDVPLRNLETSHLYVVPGEEIGSQYPWVFAGDGKPPNGAKPVGTGEEFPLEANDGDFFLRTDYEPHVLYQKKGKRWYRIEADYRKRWYSANRLLQKFIGTPDDPNKDVILDNGRREPQRQNIRKVVKPKANL